MTACLECGIDQEEFDVMYRVVCAADDLITEAASDEFRENIVTASMVLRNAVYEYRKIGWVAKKGEDNAVQ